MGELRFLVVDDDTGVGTLISIMAKNYGPTDLVTDGWCAFEAFRSAYEINRPYNLVFLDIVLPGIDGQSLLRSMREYEYSHHANRQNDCRIVMITASREPNDILEAYKNQCDGFLTKPFTRGAVLEALQMVRLSEG